MTAIKLINGAWQVSDIVCGHLVIRTFYGFTKREALRLFASDTRGQAKRKR